MAKQNPSGGERSKVRLLFVDGEFAQGEIQALALAFARPVVPVRPVQKRLATSSVESVVVEDERDIESYVEEDTSFEDDHAAAPAKQRSSRGKRTYPTPDTVDVELESGEKPFSAFAIEKQPQTHLDKYLVAAEWLRAYRNTPTITTGHVRTCYIGADWTFDPLDPIQPFRKLKKDGLGTVADSKFTLNHLGTAAVKKMNTHANV